MVKSIMTKPLYVFALLLIPVLGIAQTYDEASRFHRHFEIGANAGTSIFFGDVKQNPYWPAKINDVSEWNFAGGLNLNYHFGF